MPFVFFLGRLCEEFHCLPSAALKEYRKWPAGTLEDIIEARAFAAAKRHYESLNDGKAIAAYVSESPLAALVQQIEFDRAAEALQTNGGHAPS